MLLPCTLLECPAPLVALQSSFLSCFPTLCKSTRAVPPWTPFSNGARTGNPLHQQIHRHLGRCPCSLKHHHPAQGHQRTIWAKHVLQPSQPSLSFCPTLLL